ncbi:MAG: hypothetical protein ACSW8C_02540 [bacterium]
MNIGIVNTILPNNPEIDTFIGISSHFQDIPLVPSDKAVNGYVSSGSYLDFEWLFDKLLSIDSVKHIVYSLELFWVEPRFQKAFLNTENVLLRSINWSFKTILSYLGVKKHEGKNHILGWSYRWGEPSFQKAQRNFWKEAKEIKLFQNFEEQKISEEQKATFGEIIDKHILPHVLKAKNKTFHFVIPPYSFIRFLETELTLQYVYLQRLLVEKLSNVENVKIYGFYDCDFVQNLANYYDSHHAQPDIVRFYFYCTKRNWHRLTLDNYDNYEKKMLNALKTFKVKDFYPPMDRFINLVKLEEEKHNKSVPNTEM